MEASEPRIFSTVSAYRTSNTSTRGVESPRM